MKLPDKKPGITCDPKTAHRLTEIEHRDSCDARVMLKMAARGQDIRTRTLGDYGHQENYGSRTDILLHKKEIEENLDRLAKNEGIDPQELKKAPMQTIATHLRKKNADKKSASPTPIEAADKATTGVAANEAGNPAGDAGNKTETK